MLLLLKKGYISQRISRIYTCINLWPLNVLKATAGGGGRGMRLAKEPEEFVKLLQVLFILYSLSYGPLSVFVHSK